MTHDVTAPRPRPSSRRERDWLRSAFEGLEVGVAVVDASSHLLVCNQAARELLGLGQGRYDPCANGRLLHEDGTACLPEEEPVRRALTAGEISSGRVLGRLGPRGMRWLSVHARPLHERGQRIPYGAVALFVDVTQAHDRERALRESDQLFRSLSEHSSDWVARLTPDLRLLYQSPGGQRLLGWSPDASLGESAWQWVHEQDLDLVQAEIARLQSGADETRRIPVRVRRQDGTYLWIESVSRAIRDEHGRLVEIQAMSHDISERVAHEEHLSRLALTDTLTGLANRSAVIDWLGGAQSRGSSLAVLYLDVDRFKVVNDCLGHEVGDRLLVQVASRIGRVARPGDLLARLGGDEFALLCEDVTEVDARALADELAQVLEESIEVDGHSFAVSASIGIVCGPVTADPYRLLREADAAMYDAKERGRARAVVYTAALGARADERLETEAGLRAALSTGDVLPYYQPIVDLRTTTIVGVEALVRWRHPVRGTVGPVDFLPVAEDSGLIIPVGRAVIAQALQQLARWRAELPMAGDLELAVNLCGAELSWEDTVPWLLDLVDASGVPRSAVTVEVLESAILSAEPVLDTLRGLRAGGLRLGLDDFGTGNSSLANLRRVPSDLVKVDASFVRGLGHDPWDEAIVLATRDLATAFRAQLLAEGVETEEQASWLRERGVPYAQGYLFGRPQPADELAQLLVGTG